MSRKERRAAAKLERQAARMDIGTAGLFRSALQHHQAGRVSEAEALYRRVLIVQADHADACFNLAMALKQQGKLEQAVTIYRQTIAMRPDSVEAHYNLGNTLMGLGRPEDAAAAYRAAIELKPDLVQAYSNLGVALRNQGKLAEAAAVYVQTIRLRGCLENRITGFPGRPKYDSGFGCGPKKAVGGTPLSRARRSAIRAI